MTVNINAANITSIRLAEQSSAPSTPASGFAQLFVDTNGDLATRKDAGGIKIATSPASGDYTLTVDGTGTAARLNAANVFTSTAQFATTISVGGVTPSASGSGITFPASQSASSDVNTLDDYEEGAWTPTALYSTSNGDRSYDVQVGQYTRIGRLVHIQGLLQFDETTASGNFSIGGLPFPANATASNFAGCPIYSDNLTGISGQLQVLMGAGLAANQMFVYFLGTGTGTALTQAHTGTNTAFAFSICYQV